MTTNLTAKDVIRDYFENMSEDDFENNSAEEMTEELWTNIQEWAKTTLPASSSIRIIERKTDGS